MKNFLLFLLAFISITSNAQFSILKEINSSTNSSFVNSFNFQLDSSHVLFQASNELGAELWVTNGKPEGTNLFLDVNPGNGGCLISNMFKLDSLLIFKAEFTNPDSNFVFIYNLKNAYLKKIIGVNGVGTYPIDIVNYKDRVYFKIYENGIKHYFFSISGDSLSLSENSPGTNNLNKDGKLYFIQDSKIVVLEENFNFVDLSNTNNTAGHLKIFQKGDSLLYIKKGSNQQKIMYLPSDFSIPSELGTMIFSLNNLKILDVNDGKVIFNTNLILENNSLNQMGLSEFDLNTLQTNSLGSIRLSLSESILFNSLKLIHFKGNHYIYTTLTSDSYPYYIWKVQNNNTSQFYSRPSGGLLYSFIEFENNLYFGYTNFGFDIKHLLLKSDGNTINTYRLSGGVLNYTQFRNIGVPFLAGGKLIFWGETTSNKIEPYIYQPSLCEGNRNQSIKSGNWNDSSTWYCGQIPQSYEWVIINSGHKINLNNNERVFIKKLTVSPNSVFETPKGTTFSVTPSSMDY